MNGFIYVALYEYNWREIKVTGNERSTLLHYVLRDESTVSDWFLIKFGGINIKRRS